mmetsp:Transcript_362/g.1061  ORF Transcript_362/g.1061 Transcript_362/m.1061 type:complete len:86 (+) Transcript_362:1058-1315(+)
MAEGGHLALVEVDQPLWFGGLSGGYEGIFEILLVEDGADIMREGTVTDGFAIRTRLDVEGHAAGCDVRSDNAFIGGRQVWLNGVE